MIRSKKKGIGKRALSVSLAAAMLLTSNVSAWAGFEVEPVDAEVQDAFETVVAENTDMLAAAPTDIAVALKDSSDNDITAAKVGDTVTVKVTTTTGTLPTNEYLKVVAGTTEVAKVTGTGATVDSTGNYVVKNADLGKTIDIAVSYSTDDTTYSPATATGETSFVVYSDEPTDYYPSDLIEYADEYSATMGWNSTKIADLVSGGDYTAAFVVKNDSDVPQSTIGTATAKVEKDNADYDLQGTADDIGATITIEVPVTTNNDGNLKDADQNLIPGLGDDEDGVLKVTKTITIGAPVQEGAIPISDTTWKLDDTSAPLDFGAIPVYTYDTEKEYNPVLHSFKLNGKTYIADNGGDITVAYTRVNNTKPGLRDDGTDHADAPKAVAAVSVTGTTQNEIGATITIDPLYYDIKGSELTGVTFPKEVVYAPTATEFIENIRTSTSANGKKQGDEGVRNAEADYEVKVKVGNAVLTSGDAAPAVGTTVVIRVEGKNNFNGKVVESNPIKVTPYDIKNAWCKPVPAQAFTGDLIDPSSLVELRYTKENGSVLTKGTDYTVSASNNKLAGTATITYTAKSANYTGTKEQTFEIVSDGKFPAAFESAVDTAVGNIIAGNRTYTGNPIRPIVGSIGTLSLGSDYTMEYSNNINVGIAKITFTGIGSYNNAKYTAEFEIVPANLNTTTVTVADTVYSEDWQQAKPAVTVTYNGRTLTDGIDYTVTYTPVPGTPNTITATLSPVANGNFTGSTSEIGKVLAKNIADITIPNAVAQPYTGYPYLLDAAVPSTSEQIKLADGTAFKDGIKDGNKVLTASDYVVTYKNNTNVGTAEMTLTGKGNYQGKVVITFPITQEEINATFVYTDGAADYPGVPELKYDPKEAATDTGITHLASSSSFKAGKTFKVIGINSKQVYTLDTDYICRYTDNKAVGTATIEAVGIGAYEGKLYASTTFKIVPQEITSGSVTVAAGPYYYTGEELKPKYTVAITDTNNGNSYALVEGTDYQVAYVNNVNANTEKDTTTPITGAAQPQIVVTGLGNYKLGTDAENAKANKGFTGNFDIAVTAVRPSDITISNTAYAGGIEVTPEIKVINQHSGKELALNTDYTVELKDAAKVGIAEATIKIANGQKNYVLTADVAGNNGTVQSETKIKFQVAKKALSDCEASVVDGKVVIKNGEITVPETEYDVAENEDGTFTVTAKADGNYTGTITVSGEPEVEAPAATQVRVVTKDTSSVTLAWDKVEGAEGYTIWYHSERDSQNSRKVIANGDTTTWTQKGLAPGTKYFYTVRAWVKDAEGKYVFGEETSYVRGTTKPFAAKIAKVTATNGKIKVTLADKAAGAEKYSMCYSTSSSFSKFAVGVRTSYTSRTFTKAVAKGTYYVRVKSYRELGGTSKIYGEWSNTMKVVVK